MTNNNTLVTLTSELVETKKNYHGVESVVDWTPLEKYLNNRFVLQIETLNGDDSVFCGRYTVADNDGNIEKFTVQIMLSTNDKCHHRYTQAAFIKYRTEYCKKTCGKTMSSMTYIANMFNLPLMDAEEQRVKFNNRYLLPFFSKLTSGENLKDYSESIIREWNRYNISKHVLSLVGGRIEVIRNNASVFTVWITTTGTIRYTRKELIAEINKVRKSVDRIAIDALCEDKEFKKLGLKPGFFKADRITLTNDRQLVYTFDLKNQVRDLLVAGKRDAI